MATITSTRIEEDHLAKLKRIAKLTKRSMTQALGVMIEAELTRLEASVDQGGDINS